MLEEKIEIENINTPGRVERVNREKYIAMRDALLPVLPTEPPGLKIADAKETLLPCLPSNLFPEGRTAGWWLKAVQLDLEAKGYILRAIGKPVRLYRNDQNPWFSSVARCGGVHHRWLIDNGACRPRLT